jgi:hypothetical protein
VAGHPPRPRRPQLGSLRGVRTEMARLYHAALSGELDPAKASRLTFMRKEIRACLGSEALTRLEARLAELTTQKE